MATNTENRGKKINDHEDIPNCPRFDPPMTIRRYSHVASCIKKLDERPMRVVDFGCSDLNFLRYLKQMEYVHEVSAVDIDECVLQCNRFKATPLPADFLSRRSDPLAMLIYTGSLVEKDARLQGYEVVTGIELIEHLHEDVLCQVPEAIFGFVRPKLAVFTTPNADFNVLFPTLEGFRHWDHKFEWTRKEFEDWCDNVIKKYPVYTYTCEGIGEGPEGTENLGCCTQAAIFRLQDNGYRDKIEEFRDTPYKLLARVDFPVRQVVVPSQNGILSDVEYFLKVLAKRMDWSNDPVLIPINKLLVFPRIKELCGSIDELRKVLEPKYRIVFRERRPCIEYQMEDSDCEGNSESRN